MNRLSYEDGILDYTDVIHTYIAARTIGGLYETVFRLEAYPPKLKKTTTG